MNSDLLNKVVRYLASQGVAVENTVEFRQAVISLTITTLVELGMEVPESLDTVMGEGFFRSVSDTCWEKLNAA